jgi:hypothetical protein
MRFLSLATTALLGMAAMSTLAQAPTMDPNKVMRPGDPPGTRDSRPRSDNAGNISPADTTSNVALALPSSPAGLGGTPRDYRVSARASLVAGRTGEAQQSLEMAETRALGGSVSPDKASVPSDSVMVARIRGALHALGDGDKARAIALIDVALSG